MYAKIHAMNMTDQDAVLVARAKAGDFDAFELLVNGHERRLYSLAMRIVRQREEAEDVVQSAFVSALEHLSGFREESSFGTWIATIVTHAALKVLRKRKGLDTTSLEAATEEDDDGDIPHPEYIADWRDEPQKILERRELRKVLDEAIESLSEKYRLVFLLRDIEELSVEETSRTLGITESNVKVRLLRARLMLRERLTRLFGDESKRVERGHQHQ